MSYPGLQHRLCAHILVCLFFCFGQCLYLCWGSLGCLFGVWVRAAPLHLQTWRIDFQLPGSAAAAAMGAVTLATGRPRALWAWLRAHFGSNCMVCEGMCVPLPSCQLLCASALSTKTHKTVVGAAWLTSNNFQGFGTVCMPLA